MNRSNRGAEKVITSLLKCAPKGPLSMRATTCVWLMVLCSALESLDSLWGAAMTVRILGYISLQCTVDEHCRC